MGENKKSKPLSAREKIARLRKTFLEQLPARIKQAEALLEQIKADPADHVADADLHRFCTTSRVQGVRSASVSLAKRQEGSAKR